MADNPSAFPSVEPRDPQFSSAHPGMTLRDWFAGQAIPAAITVVNTAPLKGATNEELSGAVAALSYMVADAMLQQRERGQ